jgi:hypothetical protein
MFRSGDQELARKDPPLRDIFDIAHVEPRGVGVKAILAKDARERPI